MIISRQCSKWEEWIIPSVSRITDFEDVRLQPKRLETFTADNVNES